MPKTKPQNLDEALRERGSLARLASRLNVQVTYLCDIRKGRRVPPLRLALAIQHETGVPIESLLKGKAA